MLDNGCLIEFMYIFFDYTRIQGKTQFFNNNDKEKQLNFKWSFQFSIFNFQFCFMSGIIFFGFLGKRVEMLVGKLWIL
jgi:hypothetical protein